jgi:hypothetical protein
MNCDGHVDDGDFDFVLCNYAAALAACSPHVLFFAAICEAKATAEGEGAEVCGLRHREALGAAGGAGQGSKLS